MFKAEWIKRAYERILELPVGLVVVVLWFVGLAVLAALVLGFYLYGSALVRMLLAP